MDNLKQNQRISMNTEIILMIIAAVWGENSSVDAQFVRVLVGQLRQKVEADPARPRLVCTEPGVGYRLGA